MQVAVLGAGTMGREVARACALAGHEVRLRDTDSLVVREAVDAIGEQLGRRVERRKLSESDATATMDRIVPTQNFADMTGVTVAIEAVPDDLTTKRDVLSTAEDYFLTDTVLATTTDTLPVTDVASALQRPERAVGLHFFEPVDLTGIVEVVIAEQTEAGAAQRATSFVESLEKTPVVTRDSPGFVSSRLAVSLGVEAMRLVEEGVAHPRGVDNAMTLGTHHARGPLELADIEGLDSRLETLEYLYDELGERFRPPQLLKRKVRAGKLGREAGEGFYVWEAGEPVAAAGDAPDPMPSGGSDHRELLRSRSGSGEGDGGQ
ncbi:3-hydroxyacyl-CoA dehydrogenase family protein [Natronomonas sp. EA1]|uniref:3-hydroxyacyl-CoA dehydrogenase family protein n=1 Tax=Natronomonas sp. EA1 TaxID=3421655 RepID=UPI003EBFBAD7